MKTRQPGNQATRQLYCKSFSFHSICSLGRHSGYVLFILMTTLFACVKESSLNSEQQEEVRFSMGFQEGYVQTVIGNPRENPYTVSNMRQAYQELYNEQAQNIQCTHYYIRIEPQSIEVLRKMDTMDINTYHYPLHHEVISMGDYYLHPGKSLSDLPILYAVLRANESLENIPYTVLDTLHLGSDDEALIRKALERKGYDPDEEGYIVGRPPDYWSPDPEPIDPPAPAGPLVAERKCTCKQGLHARNPAGCISVYDTQLSMAHNCETYRGVSFVKVILKDSWFTEHEVWTNRHGCFSIPDVKYYENVWMWVKFTHSRGHVRGVRNGWVSAWDWLFIVKDYVGKLNLSNFNHLDVCYDHSMDQGSRARHHWNAASVFNSMHEYIAFAQRENIGMPPERLDMYIDRNDGGGAAYMFDKMTDKLPIINGLGAGWQVGANLCVGQHPWKNFLCLFTGLVPLVGVTAVATHFMPDIMVGCGNVGSSVRTSDRLKETGYHELGHAAHYARLPSGQRAGWWLDHVGYTVNVGSSSNPYGDGTHPGAPKCAVIEMWGYHIGHTIADAAYGTNASPAVIQYGSGQARWRYNEDISGKSSYWAALEDYDPNWTPDPSRWMPIGVLHDLMDDRVEAGFPVIDNVSGYSQQKFFNALQSDVISIPLYKARLLQQNNNNQQSNVDILFQSYNH